eukprot:1146847-Pelagomonas_calceolata.AAC.1
MVQAAEWTSSLSLYYSTGAQHLFAIRGHSCWCSHPQEAARATGCMSFSYSHAQGTAHTGAHL